MRAHFPDNVAIPLRILLADDDEINRMITAAVLERAGHAVDVAANGKEAVEAFTNGGYDVIVMDCQMPEMDGFAATRAIREREIQSAIDVNALKLVIIVALTAGCGDDDRQRCLEAGMDDYLVKPVDPQQLLAVLQKWTGGSQQISEPIDEPTGAGSDAAPIDLAAMLARCGGDPALAQSILARVPVSARASLAAIERALACGDAAAVAAAAHGICGSAAYLSAGRLASIAKQLEQLGREKRLDDAPPLLNCLRAEVDRCEAFAQKLPRHCVDNETAVAVADCRP